MGAKAVGGLVGGSAGGIIFGAMMHMMGMLGMVAGLIGTEGVAAGWAVHLVISAGIGIGYALTFGAVDPGLGASVGFGLVYGAIWWVLGPLILMPLIMGMSAFPEIGQDQILSLVGHLVYGLILGLVFAAISNRAASSSRQVRQPSER